MNEQTNLWMNKWMNEWTNLWINESMIELTNEWMNETTNEWTKQHNEWTRESNGGGADREAVHVACPTLSLLVMADVNFNF